MALLSSRRSRLSQALHAVVAILFLTAFISRDVLASFEEYPTGARAAGMGNSFTAIADDAYSTYYNPAGLVQIHRPEFTAYYAKLYSGLSDGSSIGRSFVAYAQPTENRGTFALSYLSLSLAGLYSESTYALSYAHSLGERWNLGGTMKFLQLGYGSDAYTQSAINSDTGASLGAPDPLFAQNGTGKSAESFDVGAQYRLSRIYGLGFAILNINSPNMALSSSDDNSVAAVYKLGIARRTKTSSIDVEFSERKFTTEEYRLNMGAERWIGDNFGIRGGLGFGSDQYQITSLGFTYRWDNLEFAYALIYPLEGVTGTFGTNQLSMTFRFGKRN